MQIIKKNFFWIFLSVIFLSYFLFLNFSNAGNVNVSAIRIGCGDGIIQSGEECDTSNLNGQTCTGLGFYGGTLLCYSNCTFNTSSCLTTPPPPPPPSGGGGGVPYFAPTTVVFSGKAYPKSVVTLLKDAQVVAQTVAGPDANFSITLTGITGGNYIFGIYSEDKDGIRSSLLTFPVSVTYGATTNISGIFIAPTIAVDKSEVKKGENIVIFGQSHPESEITIQVSSEEEIFVKTNSDKNGVYLYNFGTEVLDYGNHLTKSKAAKNGEISPFSKAVGFVVGTKNVFAKLPAKCPQKADLNNDCKVNLVDFSIAAYWYKRPLNDSFKLTEKQKLNGDGKIDLIDFSIMAYYWTG
jgi:hypothetical protein